LGYCASAVVIYAFSSKRFDLILPTSVGLLLAMMIATLFESKKAAEFQKIMGSVAATLLGVFYVVVLAGYLIGVRVIDEGQRASQLLSLFFLIITASDTGAYYAGRNFGRHKLAPLISPGKTVEGSIGGIVAAIGVSLLAKYTFFHELPALHAIALGVVMNIGGTF